MTDDWKTCRGCDDPKPLEAYHRSQASRDGRNGHCKECVRARQRRYRLANVDTIRARDKARESSPTRRAGHWRNTYRQRAERFGLPAVIGTGDQAVTHVAVVAAYGDGCHYSYDEICEGGFTVLDHHLPVRFGGAHTLDNVRPACRPCNTDRYYRGLRWVNPDASERAA